MTRNMNGNPISVRQNGNPDLSLPAGSLQCALRAFDGGADSVYLGMKNFSARKNAVNFSFEDLRKLKQFCIENGKKFYVTLNTLVSDSQLADVEKCLRQLDYIRPDGVIVQDLGIAHLIKTHHPELEIHASTQLAVHTPHGVEILKKAGFSRIVLARELSFEEIKRIRTSCPDTELKVFIHGAMCYGFSGLCMASEVLTGRSANCGECAQICRSWFSTDESAGKPAVQRKKFWPFSMKDLRLGDEILKLKEIGIDAFKVEGRMKSPEYTYRCAKYYRMILDGTPEDSPDLREQEKAMLLSFARENSACFFNTGSNGNKNSESLTCPDYPGHRGIRAGTIVKTMHGRAEIHFTEPVALHDGLLVIHKGQSAGFPVSHIEGGKSFISAGSTAQLDFPSEQFSEKPPQGCPVYCTSLHNMNLPLLPENLSPYRKPVDLLINLTDSALSVNGTEFPLNTGLQTAESDTDLHSVLHRIFSASDRSYFTCGKLEFANLSSVAKPFLPLSVLKRIRREFYEKLDADFVRNLEKPEPYTDCSSLPPVPVLDTDTLHAPVFHMPPLMFDEESCFREMDRIFGQAPDTWFGVNNIAQFAWAEKHKTAKIFADTFLYVKNTFAWQAINRIRKTEGIFTDSNPPLFISRTCIRHSSLGLPCSGCNGSYTLHLEQNGRSFLVKCRNCITTVTVLQL